MRSKTAQSLRAPHQPVLNLLHGIHRLFSRSDYGIDHVDDLVQRMALLIVLPYYADTHGKSD